MPGVCMVSYLRPVGQIYEAHVDLITFLGSEGPQVSIDEKHVSIRACKKNFQLSGTSIREQERCPSRKNQDQSVAALASKQNQKIELKNTEGTHTCKKRHPTNAGQQRYATCKRLRALHEPQTATLQPGICTNMTPKRHTSMISQPMPPEQHASTSKARPPPRAQQDHAQRILQEAEVLGQPPRRPKAHSGIAVPAHQAPLP